MCAVRAGEAALVEVVDGCCGTDRIVARVDGVGTRQQGQSLGWAAVIGQGRGQAGVAAQSRGAGAIFDQVVGVDPQRAVIRAIVIAGAIRSGIIGDDRIREIGCVSSDRQTTSSDGGIARDGAVCDRQRLG